MEILDNQGALVRGVVRIIHPWLLEAHFQQHGWAFGVNTFGGSNVILIHCSTTEGMYQPSTLRAMSQPGSLMQCVWTFRAFTKADDANTILMEIKRACRSLIRVWTDGLVEAGRRVMSCREADARANVWHDVYDGLGI